ncbi:hypothetical protein A8F94_19280 [Bacillus sp. FJAT-27225]|nr:hypothetical protein A8F94_19280 [Bacillus sp. FJAT-27225]
MLIHKKDRMVQLNRPVFLFISIFRILRTLIINFKSAELIVEPAEFAAKTEFQSGEKVVTF